MSIFAKTELCKGRD